MIVSCILILFVSVIPTEQHLQIDYKIGLGPISGHRTAHCSTKMRNLITIDKAINKCMVLVKTEISKFRATHTVLKQPDIFDRATFGRLLACLYSEENAFKDNDVTQLDLELSKQIFVKGMGAENKEIATLYHNMITPVCYDQAFGKVKAKINGKLWIAPNLAESFKMYHNFFACQEKLIEVFCHHDQLKMERRASKYKK